ncbi:DEAD/DEAH box helicase (plasmid) [Qingshengfaniella alkalisoli]|uniref:DEAD/DEAH box helicase n=2 Tax=Qingshengfaniella alkalisoli TaxID=2599296 RepID=A0A5B8J063_9RHOB|nr:DEAD/DEAH box helicase [Qingshengfaniella alkalisoli]QDY71294.1 DEAD/DEAH box helicase [Qingshengfaniella alkalisoli]
MITPLAEALSERGFDTLTPVQAAVIDPELTASDLLVSAQTGSGKTVAFGLAIASTLLGAEDRFGLAAAPLALVVAPTRELAFQVMRELSWLYARTGAVVTSCVGGMEMREERRALNRGAHIVVGTPGRLRDHIERGSLDLSSLRAVVLDEADEMLDLGFREDLEFMLDSAPETRRTLLFSATVPPAIAKMAQRFQRDARRIDTIGRSDQHADITYQALRVSASDSENAIFNLLRYHHDQTAIVFANTRAAVNHLMARLANRGLATVCLSGELSQSERTHALQAMRDGRARVCVATDVAARGIDLPNLSLVIHADLPTNTESLLHRSGRTGRAGRKGISALIVPPKAVKKAERLLKWAKISASWIVAPSVDEILQKDEERLLTDPAWDEPLTEQQSLFASKLLEQQSPESIAAAYLRLYQERHAAPEELLPPDTKPSVREPRDFGPSRWFTLSVGRDDNAEARWILPLLCRAGSLDKAAIGAIRVQDAETFVELSEPRAEGFLAAIGEEGVLEEGISVRALDSPPELPMRRADKRDGAATARRDHTERRKPTHRRENADKPDQPAGRAPYKAKGDKKTPAKTSRSDVGSNRSERAVPNVKKPKKARGDGADGVQSSRTAAARDTSKRFTPPGKTKSPSKKPRNASSKRGGGSQPPRRGKK